MKKAIVIILSLTCFQSFANPQISKCQKLAEKAVSFHVQDNGYDTNGFEAYKCDLANNNAAFICEVAASKGQGAASDTYRVILNKNCNYVFRIDFIGEE